MPKCRNEERQRFLDYFSADILSSFYVPFFPYGAILLKKAQYFQRRSEFRLRNLCGATGDANDGSRSAVNFGGEMERWDMNGEEEGEAAAA